MKIDRRGFLSAAAGTAAITMSSGCLFGNNKLTYSNDPENWLITPKQNNPGLYTFKTVDLERIDNLEGLSRALNLDDLTSFFLRKSSDLEKLVDINYSAGRFTAIKANSNSLKSNLEEFQNEVENAGGTSNSYKRKKQKITEIETSTYKKTNALVHDGFLTLARSDEDVREKFLRFIKTGATRKIPYTRKNQPTRLLTDKLSDKDIVVGKNVQDTDSGFLTYNLQVFGTGFNIKNEEAKGKYVWIYPSSQDISMDSVKMQISQLKDPELVDIKTDGRVVSADIETTKPNFYKKKEV